MRINEITDAEDALYQKGYQDGLNGVPDFEWLGTGKNERPYWLGYDRGKFQFDANRPKPKPPLRRIKQAAGKLAKVIPDQDLIATYTALISGHHLDNVREIPAREPDEAMEAIREATTQLAAQFIGGTIRLYRTIRVDDPASFVATLSRPQHLGRHWSISEHYTMGHDPAETVLFCIDAPVSSIDWAESLILIIDGVEAEIRLKQNHPIKLAYSEPHSPAAIETHLV